ncbi:TerD family protein [Phocaeicola paurosaccharolyticus]|uniref:TerD family protein n=1 Tax=Phocaeicola paurosaccharolyticus TaxID=732242 RepID=UPI00046804C8|nr:TerD family protein [Phocaeicola paurosaccharolyticus]
MAVNLVKGENKVLKDMDIFHVGLGWDVNEGASQYPFDLDVAAFMIGSNKKTLADDYLVFYNSSKRVLPSNLKIIVPSSNWPSTEEGNQKMRHESRPVDPELSVIGSVDDEDGQTSEDGDDETMDIDLSKVRSDIQEIIISVSIYEYEKRKQNFGQVERAYVRLYKPGHEKEGAEEYRYDLTEDFSTCASIEFCRLYRHNGEWKIQALGIGHKGGLEELVSKFM